MLLSRVCPLWTATGSGAVSRRILGTVVIGGMLAATGIAIFLIPVTFLSYARSWPLGERKRFRSPHSGSAAGARHSGRRNQE